MASKTTWQPKAAEPYFGDLRLFTSVQNISSTSFIKWKYSLSKWGLAKENHLDFNSAFPDIGKSNFWYPVVGNYFLISGIRFPVIYTIVWFCSGAMLVYRPSCNAEGGCHAKLIAPELLLLLPLDLTMYPRMYHCFINILRAVQSRPGGGTRVHHGRVGSAGLCDLKILHPWRRLKKGVKILLWPPHARKGGSIFYISIGGLPMCVLSYIFAWHRGSSGQRPPVVCTGD